MQRAEEIESYRQALEEAEKSRRERAREVREAEYDTKLAVEQAADDRNQTWYEQQEQRTVAMEDRKEELATVERARISAGEERSTQARTDADVLREQNEAMVTRGAATGAVRQRDVENEKVSLQAREATYSGNSASTRAVVKERLDNIVVNQPRGYADYNRSKLAQEYPEGVTEESYTEGNKVIIRRVVVNGNKADDYSKVIAKWGTFYFKNGQSISEVTWSKETGS